MKIQIDLLTGLPVLLTEGDKPKSGGGGGGGGGGSSSPSILLVPIAPTTGQEGIIYQVTGDPTKSYYFIGSHRYRLDATLDDPSSVTIGRMIATGSLFGLTYAS